MMALTATATPRVRKDILNQLKLTEPKWSINFSVAIVYLRSIFPTGLCRVLTVPISSIL